MAYVSVSLVHINDSLTSLPRKVRSIGLYEPCVLSRWQVERLEAELTSLRSGQAESSSVAPAPAENLELPEVSPHSVIMAASSSAPAQVPGPSDMSRSRSQPFTHNPPSDVPRGHNPSNPLPPPPDMSRLQNLSNPLPAPPRPVSPERLASIGRSPALSSFNLHRTASTSRANATQSGTGMQSSPNGRSRFEDPRALRRDRNLPTGVLVPGAQQKVVPPRPVDQLDHRTPSGRTWNPLSASASHMPPPGANISEGGVSLRREQKEDGQSVWYQYGFVPGTGYAWFQVPYPSQSQASLTPTQSNATAGPSRNGTATASVAPGANARGRSIYEQPIVEDNSRPEAGPSSPRTNRDRTPSRRSSHRQSSSRAAEPEQPPAAPAQRSHSGSLSSLSGMTLLNVPPLPAPGTVSTVADRRDIMDILGVNTPQANPSQPSPATTWGTVHSSQVPSRTSNNPSHNPSVSDLGLLGLPEPAALVGSSDEDSQSDSSTGDASDSIDRDEFMTPRSRPLSYGRSVASPEHAPPAHSASGMGLMLDSGTRRNVHPTIRGPQELQAVTESLMRLVDQDGQDSQRHRSSERFTSTPNPRDPPDAILGARTGVPLYSSRPQSIRPDMAYGSASHSRSGSSHRIDREYMSDSEHAHSRAVHEHYHTPSQTRHRSSRRQSALSSEVVIPPPPVTAPSAYHRQPSAPSHVSERGPRAARYESPAHATTPRERRTHSSAPASAVDASASLSSLSLHQPQGGLQLSFAPATSGSSSAVSATGQDSAIRAPAPQPVSSRSSSLLGGLWNVRSGR